MQTSNHPVFRRPTRQQLVTRRRTLGLQALVFQVADDESPSVFDEQLATSLSSPASNCNLCGRHFNALWKALRCHLCGFFVCDPCSRVVERERELHLIHFVRCCAPCLVRVNAHSQLMDPGQLADYAATPWVTVSGSTSQLSFHLADMLRRSEKLRPAVLKLLRRLGRPNIGTHETLNGITSEDWEATAAVVPSAANGMEVECSSMHGGTGADINESTAAARELSSTERAQFLVQQCFEVHVPELPVDACVFAEADGRRTYTLAFDSDTGIASAPLVPNDWVREAAIDTCEMLRPTFLTAEMKLVCILAAKQLGATAGAVTVVSQDRQFALNLCSELGPASTERAHSCCAYAATSAQPFMVRNTLLDLRFCQFPAVRSTESLRFYVSFPVLNVTQTLTVAHLTVVDTKPRVSITNVQYATLRRLTDVLTSLCVTTDMDLDDLSWLYQ